MITVQVNFGFHDEFSNVLLNIFLCKYTAIKVAATDLRYFTRSKFYRSLVHNENSQ